jgi:hypothetical protein
LLLLFAFAFAFCSTPFFEWLKAANLEEREKRKIGSPDPGHYWPDPDAGPGSGPPGPDFDSGSGLKSAFTDPSPCAALTHSRLIDFFGLFHRIRTKFLVETQ